MFDIEFLMSGRNSFKSNIVYEYSTGMFKQNILLRIGAIFEERDLVIQEVDYNKFYMSSRSSSLFGDFLFLVDINRLAAENQKAKSLLQELIADILDRKINNRFLFLYREGAGEDIRDEEKYSNLLKESYILKEINLSKTTVKKVVEFLCAKDNRYFKFDKLKNREEFFNIIIQSAESVNYNLFQYVKLFEKVIYLCIEDSVFNLDKFNRFIRVTGGTEDTYALHKAVSDFIIEVSQRTRDKLYHMVCVMHLNKKYSTRLILYRIIKIVRELSFINKNLGVSEQYIASLTKYKRFFLEKFDSIPVKNILKFSLMLMKYEEKFNTEDFVFEFNRFLASF